MEYIELAVTKFEAALLIDERKHDALWCLGNALVSQGFLFSDSQHAASYFARARGCFERALAEEPSNEVYHKALEMTSRAPALHAELQKQFAAAQGEPRVGGGGGAPKGRKGGEGGSYWEDRHEWVFDYAGYVVLAGLAVAWTALAGAAKA